MVIVAVTIQPGPTAARFKLTEPKVVSATFSDGTTRDLFEFFGDELHFTAAEFVGLTETQAHDLHHQRDVDWLRS